MNIEQRPANPAPIDLATPEPAPAPASSAPRLQGLTPSQFAQLRYEALQRGAKACRREHTMLERLCIGGVIASFIWLARDADLYAGTSNLVWFLPIVIAFYGALKSQAIDARMARLHESIAAMESLAAGEAGLPLPASGLRARWVVRRLVWIVFVALTAGASAVGFQGGTLVPDDDDDGNEQTTTRWAAEGDRHRDQPRSMPLRERRPASPAISASALFSSITSAYLA